MLNILPDTTAKYLAANHSVGNQADPVDELPLTIVTAAGLYLQPGRQAEAISLLETACAIYRADHEEQEPLWH